ncbi:MAG: cyclase family protein [Spirochaetota bacterium]|nr:MAG: cyclase family protein [Spirochaetota bacterium]
MKVIDVSGPIFTGMWSYADYYPDFKLSAVEFEFGGEKYSVDVFEGMHAQTGTYMETPVIFGEGDKKGGLNDVVPIEKLFHIDAYILQIDHDSLGIKDGKPFISLDDVKGAEKEEIPEGAAILVGTGYGKNWEKEDYVQKSCFFKKDALYHLIDKKPFLIGGDAPVWENEVNPEGAFERFYKEGILLLAPLINLEKISRFKVKLTVLPLKILGAGVCPVRAVVVEE